VRSLHRINRSPDSPHRICKLGGPTEADPGELLIVGGTSGINRSIGSSNWKRPSSNRRSAAQEVTSFVFEKARNMWSTRNGVCASLSGPPDTFQIYQISADEHGGGDPRQNVAINEPLHGSVRRPRSYLLARSGEDTHSRGSSNQWSYTQLRAETWFRRRLAISKLSFRTKCIRRGQRMLARGPKRLMTDGQSMSALPW
jgi:hypothetical protein